MSGHSKWATIKHKKAITDAKKGKEFTKAAALITIAAKQGGGDPKMNFSLRLAIDKAKSVNMPAANIERAIKKGTGELGGAAPEDLLYEGYAQSGVAVIVEAMTDNRNRTGPEIRATFSKYGGSLAESGSVAYQFDKLAELVLDKKDQKLKSEDIEMAIIEAEADDFSVEDDAYFVYARPTALQQVKESLEARGVLISEAQLMYKPKNEVKIEDEIIAGKIMRLIDALEENEDVTNVYANFDIAAEILEKI